MTSKGKGKITYSVKKSEKAKRMRLAVYCDGSVVITSPMGIRMSVVEKFFEDKKQWVLKKLEYFKESDVALVRKYSQADYVKYKDEAMEFVVDRVAYFNSDGKFKFNNIFIKNQKTRWGSCSRKGNLNFNYKILFLPKEIQDYIIVHEMCHLKEFNHSKKFWNLVESVMPEYLEIKKELRKHELFYK